jgi:N-acetylglucosamine-6-sulfatase
MDLLPFMPQVQELESQGMTFNDYFVSDSLCCPSRASIFTGNFPHDTGVFSNVGPDGGIGAFYAHDDEQQTFNLALQRAGYVTAMMGKYLNGYLQPKQSPVSNTYVPPGWNVWDVAGNGYPEFDYELNQNGQLHYYGRDPNDYLTNVLAERADDFNRLPTDPPDWLAGHQPLSRRQIRQINHAYQERVEDVQSVDNLVTSIERTLVEHRELHNTYIVFSSDNGLHTGEYRLLPGKLTAFDTDIHVPLVVAGPGVRAGSSTDAMTENIDLAKTFTEIGGTSMPGDGHSLMPLLKGEKSTDWRDAVLVEHHGPDVRPTDPDAQNFDSGNPTTYEAMRTPDFLYVEYADGEREYYDLRADPYELDNIARDLSQAELARLHEQLGALERCHGAAACWAAGHVPLTR